MLSQGDELSIHVNAGLIEYRHNGSLVYESTYAGSPDFYVDTSFKSGTIAFRAALAGIVEPVVQPPPPPPPPPPTTEPRSSKSGGGGSFGWPSLAVLILLVVVAKRRCALHNFAQS
jgi:hypothetical protein